MARAVCGIDEMDILIDGEPTSIETTDLETFKDLMAHLQREIVVFPRVITRVILNEEELDEGQEIGLGAFKLTDVESLMVHTADSLDLAHESLGDAQEYLPLLSSVLEKAAATIRGGDVQSGLNEASQALEVIGAFGEVLDSLRGAYQIDFSQVRIDDLNLLDKLHELNSQANKVLKAVQSEDWTLFADLIEYELSPLLYEWMAVIPELINLLPEREMEEEKDR